MIAGELVPANTLPNPKLGLERLGQDWVSVEFVDATPMELDVFCELDVKLGGCLIKTRPVAASAMITITTIIEAVLLMALNRFTPSQPRHVHCAYYPIALLALIS